MVNYLFDACSMIYMAKIGVKEKLPSLGSIKVSPIVKSELLQDQDKFDDAKLVKTNLDKTILLKSDTEIKILPSISSLGNGELESIQICNKTGELFITDDHTALNYALRQGVTTKTSEAILLELLKQSIINRTEFDDYFRKLINIKSLKQDIIDFVNEKANNI